VKRAVAYCRVSTDRQADKGVSLEDQERRLRAQAVVSGHELVDVVVDDGYTASSLDRPGMSRVLEMVRRRRVDVVMVAKLDRLTRSVRDFADLLEMFEKHDVALMSIGESVDTGCAIGRMVLNVMMSVAQWQREDIGEKTAQALRHKRLKGEKIGGKIPYGFDVVVDVTSGKKRLIEKPEEQDVIAEVRRLRESGLSMDAIAAALNANGLKTREGGQWKRQYVWRILKSGAGE
jgi:site-specific DNA recombinase